MGRGPRNDKAMSGQRQAMSPRSSQSKELDVTARFDNFCSAYERGDHPNLADCLKGLPADQRTSLNDRINCYLIEDAPMTAYNEEDFLRWQKTPAGVSVKEAYDKAASKVNAIDSTSFAFEAGHHSFERNPDPQPKKQAASSAGPPNNNRIDNGWDKADQSKTSDKRQPSQNLRDQFLRGNANDALREHLRRPDKPDFKYLDDGSNAKKDEI